MSLELTKLIPNSGMTSTKRTYRFDKFNIIIILYYFSQLLLDNIIENTLMLCLFGMKEN